MTTRIRAACPTCGCVTLAPADVQLVVSNDPTLSHYSFTCPQCSQPHVKPAGDHVIALLVSGGVEALLLDVPDEAMERHAGPVLSWDDLLDFMLADIDMHELAS